MSIKYSQRLKGLSIARCSIISIRNPPNRSIVWILEAPDDHSLTLSWYEHRHCRNSQTGKYSRRLSFYEYKTKRLFRSWVMVYSQTALLIPGAAP